MTRVLGSQALGAHCGHGIQEGGVHIPSDFECQAAPRFKGDMNQQRDVNEAGRQRVERESVCVCLSVCL